MSADVLTPAVPAGLPARADFGLGFFLVTAANGTAMLIFRSPDPTWAGLGCAGLGCPGLGCPGLGCAGLGVVGAPVTCGELESGAAVGVGAAVVEVPAVPMVESPDGEYAGLADADGGVLGRGSGSPVVGQVIAGSSDHRLELDDHRLEPDHGLDSLEVDHGLDSLELDHGLGS